MASKRPKTAIVQLKLRLDEPLRAKLEKSARQRPPRGLSLNAEIVNRLEQSFQWDQTLEGQKKLKADFDHAIAKGKEGAMHEWRIQPVLGRPGHWIEIDMINMQDMVALNPALEAIIEQVVIRTLERAKQS